MILRTVTLQEANGLLPLVREHFIRIHLMLDKIHSKPGALNIIPQTVFDKKCELLQLVTLRSKLKKRLSPKKKREFYRMIEREIHSITRLGAIVRTIAPPHIDFPSLENGQIVFLCWHGGDDAILHWHYPDDHVAIRQTILPDRLGPNMVH